MVTTLREIIVPYDDRAKVEQLSAIKSKSPFYFVPENIDISLFKYWNRPRLSAVITGEDRGFGNNWLYVDLIPSSCWYTNVRNNVDAIDWERLKEMCKKRVHYRCELCGTEADYSQKNFLECHERYLFDKNKNIQKILRFMCVCSMCQKVTHFGLTQIQNPRLPNRCGECSRRPVYRPKQGQLRFFYRGRTANQYPAKRV